jgi:TetR/AcrR family transcriptional repressor of bet genes
MPKIVDHDERRERISAAAAQAIDEQGLDRVRLVDVARRAGCTTGAVGHYFPDKDAVMAGALEHVFRNLAAMTPPRGSLTDSGDAVERCLDVLIEILPIDERRRSDWRVWIAFCGRAVSTPILAEIHRQAYAEIQESLAGTLCDLGLALPGPDADVLATAVFASFDGLGLRATLEPDSWPSERLRSMLAYQLVPLLRTPRNVDLSQIQPSQPAQAQERSA